MHLPEPVLVMADRRRLPHHDPEAEPVLLSREGRALVVQLDDGETVTFDAVEVFSFLRDSIAAALAEAA